MRARSRVKKNFDEGYNFKRLEIIDKIKELGYEKTSAEKLEEIIKEKKHRHKWEQEAVSCPRCNLRRILACDCGEWKEEKIKTF